MIELPLIFIAGLLGSSHCIGMCGGFALLIGMGDSNVRSNLWAQTVYSLGRIFTYLVLGVLAGYFGNRLSTQLSGWVNVPAILSVTAGIFLIIQGLIAAGVRFRKQKQFTSHGCLAGSFLATFLRSKKTSDRFIAGLLTGLLPCGLVYAFLSMAAASGSLITGSLVMLVFGFGTVPLMMLTGVSGSLMSLIARQRLLKLAAWCVVITGVLTLARGAGYLSLPGSTAQPACPICVQTIE